MARAVKNSNNIKKTIVWASEWVNNTKEYVNAQEMFRTTTNHFKSYADRRECESYIRSLPKGHRVILIVDSLYGQWIVPRIHQLSQVSVIFVFCQNKKNQGWTKAYSKIKRVIEDINELVLEVLSVQEKQKNSDRYQGTLPITIFHRNGRHEQSTTELNGQFAHSQILIDCLLRMKASKRDRKDFLSYCRKEYANDSSQMKIIDEFERDYSSQTALTWYTRDCFLYRLLNQALRSIDVDLLYLFSFFIRDLHEQLKQNQYRTSIKTYRGQLMSKKEVQQLKNSSGQLISMNSFLSTTFDRDIAIIFSGATGPPDQNNQSVLFDIQADPQVDGNRPFADITSFSYMGDEELLMMLGSIFRIVHIHSEGHLCIIQLVFCNEKGLDIQEIFEQMKFDYHADGQTNAAAYGIVLANMGKYHEAEKYLQLSLHELNPTHHTEETYEYNRSVYNVNLGNVANRQGDYRKALKLHQEALQIRLRLRKANDPSIADIHNLIGGTYFHLNEYERAMHSFNEALKIYRQAYGDDHEKLAEVYSNIGATYLKQKQHSEALVHQKKGLDIQMKHLHENHHLLGAAHINIATSYVCLHDCDHALEHFHHALKIFERSFPPDHPNFANIYNNMGAMYIEKRDLQQALSYFEKAAAILHQTVGPSHPDSLDIQQNIQYIRSYLHK